MIEKATRFVYRLLGILYILIGSGSMLLPTGWLPRTLADRFMQGETPTAFLAHLLQEFGTVLLQRRAARKDQAAGAA